MSLGGRERVLIASLFPQDARTQQPCMVRDFAALELGKLLQRFLIFPGLPVVFCLFQILNGVGLRHGGTGP